MDNVSVKKRSETMRAIKSKGSQLEVSLRKELFKKGYRYRINVSKMFGKPDIAFIRNKVVIFIDSCFWHGCKYHCRLPKSNKVYWKNKIQGNRMRDKHVKRHYKSKGWAVLRIWEHEIKKSKSKVVGKIERLLAKRLLKL